MGAPTLFPPNSISPSLAKMYRPNNVCITALGASLYLWLVPNVVVARDQKLPLDQAKHCIGGFNFRSCWLVLRVAGEPCHWGCWQPHLGRCSSMSPTNASHSCDGRSSTKASMRLPRITTLQLHCLQGKPPISRFQRNAVPPQLLWTPFPRRRCSHPRANC